MFPLLVAGLSSSSTSLTAGKLESWSCSPMRHAYCYLVQKLIHKVSLRNNGGMKLPPSSQHRMEGHPMHDTSRSRGAHVNIPRCPSARANSSAQWEVISTMHQLVKM
uniref:Putative secreted protein n=1 Tax=Ixodes ricinus TaxID=34613 RepID=A0A6B0U9B3_IXORI